MMVWLPIAITVGIVGFVAAMVWVVGPLYDRYPWLKMWLDAWALTVPGYVPPDIPDWHDVLPPEYVADIPGWDRQDAPVSK